MPSDGREAAAMNILSIFKLAQTAPAEAASGSISRARFVALVLGLIIGFGVVTWRLTALGFVTPQDRDGQLIAAISTALHRPTIVDRKGRILATDIRAGLPFRRSPAHLRSR